MQSEHFNVNFKILAILQTKSDLVAQAPAPPGCHGNQLMLLMFLWSLAWEQQADDRHL